MPEWHTRCTDDRCHWYCLRPGCLNPNIHFLIHQENGESRHNYNCLTPLSAARQVVEEIHAGMPPDEIAIARRVLAEALDKLEELEKKRPTVYRETA